MSVAAFSGLTHDSRSRNLEGPAEQERLILLESWTVQAVRESGDGFWFRGYGRTTGGTQAWVEPGEKLGRFGLSEGMLADPEASR